MAKKVESADVVAAGRLALDIIKGSGASLASQNGASALLDESIALLRNRIKGA